MQNRLREVGIDKVFQEDKDEPDYEMEEDDDDDDGVADLDGANDAIAE